MPIKSSFFTNVTSALKVFLNDMRTINPRFTYLLYLGLAITTCCHAKVHRVNQVVPWPPSAILAPDGWIYVLSPNSIMPTFVRRPWQTHDVRVYLSRRRRLRTSPFLVVDVADSAVSATQTGWLPTCHGKFFQTISKCRDDLQPRNFPVTHVTVAACVESTASIHQVPMQWYLVAGVIFVKGCQFFWCRKQETTERLPYRNNTCI